MRLLPEFELNQLLQEALFWQPLFALRTPLFMVAFPESSPTSLVDVHLMNRVSRGRVL